MHTHLPLHRDHTTIRANRPHNSFVNNRITINYSITPLVAYSQPTGPMCRIERCVISSVDIALVAMPEQVLVHLVHPRCIVRYVELLCRKRASHSSVHFHPSVLYPRLGFVCFELLSTAEVLNPRALIPWKSERVEASNNRLTRITTEKE